MNTPKGHRHMDFRVIVAGGRHFADERLLSTVLQRVLSHKLTTHNLIILSGCADGADALGERFANTWDIPVEHYPADWRKHGKAAGPIRNRQMADNAQALVAFWDGKSRGTLSMITLAEKGGLDVRIIRTDKKELS